MAAEELPPELRELEDALAARVAPDAEGASRARVLGAVRQELAAKGKWGQTPFCPYKMVSVPIFPWRFAAAAAAAVLAWLNLSMSAVNDTGFRLRAGSNGWDERAAVAEVRGLIPDCSEAEARRHVLLLRARAQLVAAPALRHARPGAGEGL